jgi:transposase
VMRYASGGGLTARERERREQVRLEAAERFARGDKSQQIAADLRVTERSVERWRRAWRERGPAGLRSKGPASLPRLSQEQFARLERELERGPLAHGFVDQRWTLVRVKTLIGRLFGVGYTVQGVWKLLRRNGWSCQRPARRAIERDDAAIEVWKKQVWPRVERPRRPATAGSSLKTRPGSR